MDFRTPGTKNVLFTRTTTLTPNSSNPQQGIVALTNVTPGTYDIAFSSPKSIHAKASNITVGSTGDVTLPSVIALHGGNADNTDDEVNFFDFELLLLAYNSNANVSTSGYIPEADFNYDGQVNLADFAILAQNYGLQGE